MVSDIVPPEKRTSIFLYLTAGVLVAELIAPILAAKLMDNGDWLPLLLALAIQQIGILIGLWFPETLHLRDLPEPRDGDTEPDIELLEKNRSPFAIKTQLRNFQDVFTFLRRDAKLGLVIFTFLANRLGRQALNMLIRYASKRYHWKIQKVCHTYSTSQSSSANMRRLRTSSRSALQPISWHLLSLSPPSTIFSSNTCGSLHTGQTYGLHGEASCLLQLPSSSWVLQHTRLF